MDNETEIAKELAKDIYADGGREIVKSTSSTINLIPRAIKAALSPLEKWIMLKEYNLEVVRRLLEKKLENISFDKISTPEPYVAVPAVEYLSYSIDNDTLREMYANLLAHSMVDVVKNSVHPGFVDIIKQLSPDEAKILKYMNDDHNVVPTINVRYQNGKGEGLDIVKNFSDIGEKSGCEIPNSTEQVFDNLSRLGLVDKTELGALINKDLYKPLKEHKFLDEYRNIQKFKEQGFKLNFTESMVQLTAFGRVFCYVCIEDVQKEELSV